MHTLQEIRSSFQSKTLTQRNAIGLLILMWQLFVTGLGIALSIQDQTVLWLLGQLVLGISFLQWFFLIHDIGHGVFLPNKTLSIIFGHLASVFCLVPYCPWKYVHQAHHKWTGWREMDPTVPNEPFEEMSKAQRSIVDFCWKYWIPLIAMSYVASTFYNVKKLDRDFFQPAKKRNNRLSIGLVVMVYLILIIVFGALFFKVWLLAAFIFLSISDPYLLSQHTHLDSKHIEEEKLKPVPFIEQDNHSRTIRFPSFVEKYIFYFQTIMVFIISIHGFRFMKWVN